MIRPAGKHALEVVSGVIGVVLIGTLVLGIKLAHGPISIRFLAPTIASLLDRSAGDYTVRVKDALVRWSPTKHALQLRVVGVEFDDANGHRMAGVPEMEVGLAMAGLRHGIVAPTRISLDHASATIERATDGSFSIGAPGGDKSSSSILPVVLERLLTPGRESAVSYLSEVAIKDADLTLIDHRTGAVIRTPSARILLQRTDGGIHVSLDAGAEIADERSKISLVGNYDPQASAGTITATFTPVRLSHLAPISDFFKPLAPFNVPVAGTAKLKLGPNAVITRADIVFSAAGGNYQPSTPGAKSIPVQSAALDATYWPQQGKIALSRLSYRASGNHADITGEIQLRSVTQEDLKITGLSADLTAADIAVVAPGHLAAPLSLNKAVFSGDLTLGPNWRLKIDTASLAFGPSALSVSGTVDEAKGAPAVALNAEVSDFQIADIGKVWPIDFAPHPRLWVVNHIDSGKLVKGTLKVDAPAGVLAQRPLPADVLTFKGSLVDGVTHYVKGLPPLTDAAASLDMTARSLTVTLSHGKIRNSDVTSGHVLISQLGVMGAPIEIDAAGNGDLTELLQDIDRKPLGFVSKYGLKPTDFTGHASVELALTIPEQSDIPPGDLNFHVKARGTDVAVASLTKEVAINHGALALTADKMGLDAKGTAEIDGAPAELAWHEAFKHRGPLSSRFAVKTTLSDNARAALGLDTSGYVMGPVGIDVTARGKGPKLHEVHGTFDFTGATLDLTDIDWTKAAGVKARASTSVVIDNAGAMTIKSLTASGEGIDVSGNARLAADGRLLSANFPKFRLDGFANGTFHVDRDKANGLVASVSGRSLNLEPIIKMAMRREQRPTHVPWRIEANLERAGLRRGVVVDGFKASIASSDSHLTVFNASGAFNGGGDFYANLSPPSDGGRWLILNASDAGQLVRGITGAESLIGGRLTLNVDLSGKTKKAAASSPAAAATAKRPANTGAAPSAAAPRPRMTGNLRIDNFKIVKVPVLAKLLTIGSLQGISDLLSGEGIEFNRLQMPFSYRRGLLTIDEARAAGPAIGVTLQGAIDRATKQSDLTGTIVPAYSLNSVLGNVPVLGQLFISRQGEGIFGFTYSVAGDIENPRVVVNPLSALAPGFLRRLFELGDAQAGELRLEQRNLAQ